LKNSTNNIIILYCLLAPIIYYSRIGGRKFVCESLPNLICYWELLYHWTDWSPLLYFMHLQRPTWTMRKATKSPTPTTVYCHKANTVPSILCSPSENILQPGGAHILVNEYEIQEAN